MKQNASPFLIYCYGHIKSGLHIKIWGGRRKLLVFIKLSNFATKFPNSKYFLFLPHLSQLRPPANSYLGPVVSSVGLAQPLAAAELQAGSASYLQGLWQGQDSGNWSRNLSGCENVHRSIKIKFFGVINYSFPQTVLFISTISEIIVLEANALAFSQTDFLNWRSFSKSENYRILGWIELEGP